LKHIYLVGNNITTLTIYWESTHTKSYSKLLICLLQHKKDVHQWSKLNVMNTIYAIHSIHFSTMQRISQF